MYKDQQFNIRIYGTYIGGQARYGTTEDTLQLLKACQKITYEILGGTVYTGISPTKSINI